MNDATTQPILDVWSRRVGALVVAAVAAYASYQHQRAFALHGGADATSAGLWPLSVDGLLLLSTAGLLKANDLTSSRIRVVSWLAFGLGIGVSLAANIASAPTLAWRPVLVAGWPPIALLLAVELLAHGRRRQSRGETDDTVEDESDTETTLASVRDDVERPREQKAEEIMWTHFQRELAAGRAPTGAELDRVAGTNKLRSRGAAPMATRGPDPVGRRTATWQELTSRVVRGDALMTVKAFTVDDGYDADMASDGNSRFGAYVRQRSTMFCEDGHPVDDSVRFALTAWRIAQPPIMSPGYVRSHPRVVNNREYWDDEGRVALAVDLAVELTAEISRSLGYIWNGWRAEGFSRQRIEPYDNDRPAAFTTLTVRVPIRADLLPPPAYRCAFPATDNARLAVNAICELINQMVGPVLSMPGLST